MKSTMTSLGKRTGNRNVLEKGVYKDQKVSVKGHSGTGKVKGANFGENKVLVEIWVDADKVMEEV